MKRVSTLLLILILLGIGEMMAQQAQPKCNIVDELQDEIYAYDWGKDLWLPFTADSLSSNLLGITLDVQRYRSLDLQLMLPASTSIFIDRKMIAHVEKESYDFLSLDSLAGQYDEAELFISFYNPAGLSPRQITLNLCSDYEWQDNEDLYAAGERELSALNDFAIVAFFLVLAYFAVAYQRFPDFFKAFFSVTSMFSPRITKEESLLSSRPINPINLFFLVGYSLLLSWLIMLGLYYYFLDEFALSINRTFIYYFSIWILISLLVLVLLHLKFFFIYLLSRLFDLGKFRNSHFIDYVGMSLIFFGIVFLVSGFTFMAWRYAITSVLGVILPILVIFLLIRVLILFFKSLSVSNFQKLHLFSYLCTSELVPALIMIKVIGF